MEWGAEGAAVNVETVNGRHSLCRDFKSGAWRGSCHTGWQQRQTCKLQWGEKQDVVVVTQDGSSVKQVLASQVFIKALETQHSMCEVDNEAWIQCIM